MRPRRTLVPVQSSNRMSSASFNSPLPLSNLLPLSCRTLPGISGFWDVDSDKKERRASFLASSVRAWTGWTPRDWHRCGTARHSGAHSGIGGGEHLEVPRPTASSWSRSVEPRPGRRSAEDSRARSRGGGSLCKRLSKIGWWRRPWSG